MGLTVAEMFPSKWLKAEDFSEGETRVLTIKDVRYEMLGQGANAEQKPVIEFREDKPLVLNKTNTHNIAKMYGGDTDEWLGKKVTLYTMEVDSFGDIVRAIRIRSEVPKNGAARPQETSNGNEAGLPSTEPGTVTAQQKIVLASEAERVYGPDYKTEVKKMIGDVKMLSNRDAAEWITHLKAKPNYQDEDYSETDPFSDEVDPIDGLN